MSKLGLPAKPDAPEIVAIRRDIVLAMIPVASRHALSNPHDIVEIASKLCDYVVTGRKQDTSPKGGPA